MNETAGQEIDLQNAIDRHLSAWEGIRLLAGVIDDHTAELYPEERAAIRTALTRRQHEFATGRVLARQSMADLSLPEGAIVRGKHREPVWPVGVLGSITHAREWAVAGVARPERTASIGIDLEITDRLGENLHRKVFTDSERQQIDPHDSKLAGLLFSAKEAAYKATYPLVGRYIGFKEVEIVLDRAPSHFRLRYVGDFEPNRVMETAEGHYLYCGCYVLSLVIIPREL